VGLSGWVTRLLLLLPAWCLPLQAPPDEGEEEALKAFDSLEQQLAAQQQH
jgi:hypothetical protein